MIHPCLCFNPIQSEALAWVYTQTMEDQLLKALQLFILVKKIDNLFSCVNTHVDALDNRARVHSLLGFASRMGTSSSHHWTQRRILSKSECCGQRHQFSSGMAPNGRSFLDTSR